MDKKIDWKQFLVSVLGTAIGVGLTFFVSGVQENHRKARAQRLTAIMVIHDVDNTIDIMKRLKEDEEKGIKLIQTVQKTQDNLDAVPYDTLSQAINYLLSDDRDFRFDTSKERIFNSDLDTWQNLGSTKFIDNIQSFFYERQIMQELLNRPDYFRGPIPGGEYLQLIQEMGWVSQEDFAAKIRPFLKKKLSEKQVQYFINISSERIRIYNQYIDFWTNRNEENKFLMGITDKEMEDYINSISNNGKALTKALLPGRWECTLEDENSYEYDFHRDNSYDYVTHYSSLVHAMYWSGRLKYSVSLSGTWSMQGDSLILNLDAPTMAIQMDLSGIEAEENKQDSLESWAKKYREDGLKHYAEKPDSEKRFSFKARLDASHDKMEWTNKDGAIYLKRK